MATKTTNAKTVNVNVNIPKLITVLLSPLPERQRDVVTKRYGLKDGKRRTLEEIGGHYKITRERVRQIENDAKSALLESEHMAKFDPFYEQMIEHFTAHGGMRPEHRLFDEDARKIFSATLEKEIARAYLHFLLSLHEQFVRHPENEKFHSIWALKDINPSTVKGMLEKVEKQLREHKETVSKEQVLSWLAELSDEKKDHVLESHLAASKAIDTNVYGEYGLAHWPEINTRGVRDKAYLVLKKHARPMHFKEIVDHINKTFALKREAHPQTVHNELIKNNRFVLVGRGMYALSDWGYQPGKVHDVLMRVLSDATKPLSKEEIIDAVLKERNVKLNTILLNLQNKTNFEKTGDGKFSLRR
ncbi:MAG: HTH domain-containing protein [Candidatus Azambacteria bacterium]|nr:HTH domain-containing protein [Candidatus Azambacteria bacterium]